MSLSWKRNPGSRAVAASLLGAGLLTAACAHGNGSQAAVGIRLAANEAEVSGCERVTGVKVIGAASREQAQAELERLTRDRGGNVLLMPGSGDGLSGTAYRCASPAATAASN